MTFYQTDTSVLKCSAIRIYEFQHRIWSSLTLCGFVLHIFTNLWCHPESKYNHTQTLQWVGASELFDNSNGCLSHTIQCSRRWRWKKEATPHLTVSAKKRKTLKILEHFWGAVSLWILGFHRGSWNLNSAKHEGWVYFSWLSFLLCNATWNIKTRICVLQYYAVTLQAEYVFCSIMQLHRRQNMCSAVLCSHVAGRITEMWIELKVEWLNCNSTARQGCTTWKD